MTPILSIVLPVYNVSEYIEKCIRSVYEQSLDISNYEVIVINDGTKDDSLEISERLQLEFTFLKIVSQENRGLSGARNTGLLHSQGEYIWFVDSDDWIEGNCLSDIVNQLSRFKADVFWMGHNVVFNDQVIRSYTPQILQGKISGEELFVSHLNNLFFIWKFIYRRKFLLDNELKFYEGILYEDLEFTPRALLKANECMTIPNTYYYYLVREGSIVTNVKDKNIQDRMFILDKLNDLKNSSDVSDRFKNQIDSVITHSFIGTIKLGGRAGLVLNKISGELLRKINIDKQTSIKVKLEYTLMRFNLRLYYGVFKSIYKIYKKIVVTR